jgi:AcrR family transcriptional regulator
MQETVISGREDRRKRLTREESRAQTRERLVEAAFQLFAREGIESVSIDRIAEEAGYSRGAFYSNFETKEDLIAAVIERDWRQSQADVAALAATRLSPEEQVEALREYALAKTTNREECMYYMELIAYGVRHSECRDMIGQAVRRDVQFFAHFIDQIFDSFGVKDHPRSEVIVSSFIAMAQGLTMRQVVDPEVLSTDIVRESLSLYFDTVFTSCIPQLKDKLGKPPTPCE